MSAPLGSSEVTIRELSRAGWPREYESVNRLWTEAGLSYRPNGRDRPDKVLVELERGTAVFLLAEADGNLAGVVVATNDGRKGWINRLAVAPGYRRRGIAAGWCAKPRPGWPKRAWTSPPRSSRRPTRRRWTSFKRSGTSTIR